YGLDTINVGGATRIVATGDFPSGSSNVQRGLASLSGGGWSAFPAMPGGVGPRRLVRSLVGPGGVEQLVVTTLPTNASGNAAPSLRRFDGARWTTLGRAINGSIESLDLLDDGRGDGAVLYVTGEFASLGGQGDAFIARWDPCLSQPLGSTYCPAVPNSTGGPALTAAFGSPLAVDNDLTLSASALPPQTFGYFITSRNQGLVVGPGGSFGNLCLDAPVGRYASSVQNSGPTGEMSLRIDLDAIPQPTGSTAALAGETWNFQAWFRDANPGVGSNFSSGLAITLE
ncbi:MAG: hypothetical protein AAGG01_20595, partial [Planctomycetota bacterium]